MAYLLERFRDGSTAFASAREDAWHRLGTVTRGAMTAEEALNAAHLSDWNVRKLPLTATEITEDGVTTLDVPDRFSTVRTNPKTKTTDYLGVVGSDYTPVQNEENCGLLNTLVDASGAHFETAGSLRGGRQVFVTMKLPETMTLAGTDRMDFYIAGLNSHDGTGAFKLVVTPIRIVCANTQSLALDRARASYSIRHTEGARKKISEARKALGLMFRYVEEFEKAAERMINEELALAEFDKVCRELWPLAKDASPRTKTNDAKRMSHLRRLFVTAPTNANIRGTRWAGVQAIGEYLDHYAPAKTDAVRAHRVLTSSELANTKQRAYGLLTV
jgi:phage/plasmid-like protein (TIGR03299 family)